MALKWKWFVGACTLGGALLLKAGAPLVPIAIGIGLAALFTWRQHRRV